MEIDSVIVLPQYDVITEGFGEMPQPQVKSKHDEKAASMQRKLGIVCMQ